MVIGVRTVDGTARAVDDYIPVNETLKIPYLEHRIEIKIINDDAEEPDEDFYLELFDPVTQKRLLGEDTRARITIIDEEKP